VHPSEAASVVWGPVTPMPFCSLWLPAVSRELAARCGHLGSDTLLWGRTFLFVLCGAYCCPAHTQCAHVVVVCGASHSPICAGRR
jgi:hypothetical protein